MRKRFLVFGMILTLLLAGVPMVSEAAEPEERTPAGEGMGTEHQRQLADR